MLSATTVRQLCPQIALTVDDSLIYNQMILSQDTTIKNSLGHKWYYIMINNISGNTVSVVDQYLIDNFLSYILSYDILKQLVVTLSYQMNDAGLRVKTSDHSQLAETRDLSFYRTYIDNFIDSKREEMNRYIRHNAASYPYYFTSVAHKTVYNFEIRKI